jgi:hypothetical protein
MKRLALNGIRAGVVATIAIVSQVGGAAAQTYDMPQFITPYDETGVGLYMVFVNGIEDIGGMATFRKAGDVNLGLRGSVNDISGGDIAFNGGLDVYKQFVEVSESFPLDVAWVTGFGFGWVTGTGEGGFGILRIPGGVSLARQFASEDGRLRPRDAVFAELAAAVRRHRRTRRGTGLRNRVLTPRKPLTNSGTTG